MKVINTSAPYIRRNTNARSAMLVTTFCLMTVLLFATFAYGLRVLLLAAVSIISCVIFESLLSFVTHLPNTVRDLSAVVTALIIVALLPPGVPLYILLLADAFAIILGKGVFGGLGNNPFNPAACALAFITVSWPSAVFAYQQPFKTVSSTIGTVVSPGASLRNGGIPLLRPIDALLGNIPSAIGTACFVVLVACFAVLCIKRIIRWRITVSFLLSSAVLAALFNRTGDVGLSVLWELFSGYLLFAAVFMLTDPSTSPKSALGSWAYGVLCALTVILMRKFGAYEEGLCFALMFCNALTPTVDRIAAHIERRKFSNILHLLRNKGENHGKNV